MTQPLPRLAVVLLSIALPALGAPAPPPNLVTNGDFESDADGNGRPDAWSWDSGLKWAEADGDHWLVCNGSETSSSAGVPLAAHYWQIRLTMRMRVTGVELGDEGWKDARLAMSFHDPSGKRIGEWPNVIHATGSSEWTSYERTFTVPWGATELRLNPANFGKRGTVEFDDISIRVVRTRTKEKEDVPLPEGFSDPWGLDDAWRRHTDTRERICLNGLWGFLPADSDAESPPADDEGWGWFKVPGIWPSADAWEPGAAAQEPYLSSWVTSRIDLKKLDQAWYRRTIDVPTGWQGRAVCLDFHMVQTHALVFVDGHRAGQVWWPGGELDITPLARPGETQMLAIRLTARPLEKTTDVFMAPERVFKSNASVKLKGLTGDVFINSTPRSARITDIHVSSSVRQGTITLDTALEGLREGPYSLSAAVLREGETVQRFASRPFETAALERGRYRFSASWLAEHLWDIHTPENLYDLQLTLLAPDGTAADEFLPVRFGFREFRIEGRDFTLNGRRIHLRALVAKNMAGAADMACLESCLNTCRRLRDSGFNYFITSNYNFSPGEVGYMDAMLEAADRTGMLASFSLPHIKDFDAKLDDPAVAEHYRRLTAWLIRRVQNHASLITYAMNHNANGYYGDQNPLKIDGKYSPETAAEEQGKTFSAHRLRMRRQSLLAAEIAASIDCTRPIYHHQSGNLGDFHTVNIYLNWAPRQERSDWLEHWSREGAKPLFFVEWGLPHVSSWSSFRGPQFIWRNPAYQRIWDAEFAAAVIGEEAFGMNETKEKSLRREEELWHHGEPFYWSQAIQYLRDQERNFLGIQGWFAADNWRSHRTWGISAMLPWDQGGIWRRVRSTPVREVPVQDQMLKQPGIVADRFFAHEFTDDTGDPGSFDVTALGQSLLRWNRPLCGFIGGGPDRFTEKTHIYTPGESLRKQFVVLNDSRLVEICELSWHLEPGDRAGRTRVGIRPGEVAKVPLVAPLAALAPGQYRLHASFVFSMGDTQADVFGFRLLPESLPPTGIEPIALFDPAGRTAANLQRLGIAHRRIDGGGEPVRGKLLIIGREALDAAERIPEAERIGSGLNVLVFEQSAETLAHRLGFRVNVHGMRRAFLRAQGHPALDGIEADMLRNWRGEATLTPPYLNVPPLEDHNPVWTWSGFENTRVWRCRNVGNVASVLIEKPPVGNWLPLVDCGFDLQYAPLLEHRVGTSRIVFCQLDVSGRTAPDPAADRLILNLVRQLLRDDPPAPTRRVHYRGDEHGRNLLTALGLTLASDQGQPSAADLLVLGPGAGPLPGLADRLRQGLKVLCLGLDGSTLKRCLPVEVATERRTVLPEHLPMPPSSEFAGISDAELYWRTTELETNAFQAPASGGNGVLRHIPYGKGSVVLCQVAPWMFDIEQKPYLRTSQRRNLFLVSRLLSNLGAAMTTPLREWLISPARVTDFALPAAWVGLDDPDDLGRRQGWDSPTFDDRAWKPIAVPGTFESARPELADYNGLFWYRLHFRLPPALERTGLSLDLGGIDDESWIWLNGHFLGELTKQTNPKDYWSAPRRYRVGSKELNWDGENIIAVRVNDTYQTGGIVGTPRLAAPGPWLKSYYLQTPESVDDPYRYYRW